MRSLAAALAILVCAGVAWGAPPAAGADEAKAAAHEHFDKGLAASNEQRFGDAAAEFEKAYAAWPDFRVLYNIGRVRATLGRSAEAVDALEAYLAQGGAEIPDDRRAEVRQAIDGQMEHVATLKVQASDDGAELRLDGKRLGQTPLAAPVRVTEGKHTLEALLPGRPAQLRELDVLGATTTELAFAFPSPKLEAPPSFGATTALVTSTPPAPHEPPRRARTVGYVVAGAGLVAAVVGSFLAYDGATSANAAKARLVASASPAGGMPDVTDVMNYDAAKVDFDDARARNQLGWAIVGAGGAAFVCGAALAIVSSSSPSRSPAAEPVHADRVSLSLVPAPGSLGLRGSW